MVTMQMTNCSIITTDERTTKNGERYLNAKINCRDSGIYSIQLYDACASRFEKMIQLSKTEKTVMNFTVKLKRERVEDGDGFRFKDFMKVIDLDYSEGGR